MDSLGFKIGEVRLDNPLVLAPLAGVTNLPFRALAKEQGAALTVTEMVSAVGLYHRGPTTMKLLETLPIERPFSVQLFGRRPEFMGPAAAMAEEMGADIIDLNMGCPARKVVRHGSGASLLKDFKLAEQIMLSIRKSVKIPFTVKTRSGWSHEEGSVLDLAPILADCGVDAVTLHPRYGNQGFGGKADWDVISRLVEKFPGPVIGNGDVTRPQHALTLLKETGCAGVMIGRAAMGNPWIFSQTLNLLQGRNFEPPPLDERFQTAVRHTLLLRDHIGENRAKYMLRSVLMWYTKGLPNSAGFRQSINRENDFERLVVLIEDYFASIGAQAEPRAEVA